MPASDCLFANKERVSTQTPTDRWSTSEKLRRIVRSDDEAPAFEKLGKIEVMLRMRPFLTAELSNKPPLITIPRDRHDVVLDLRTSDKLDGKKRLYTFDVVFAQVTTNQEVFTRIAPLVDFARTGRVTNTIG